MELRYSGILLYILIKLVKLTMKILAIDDEIDIQTLFLQFRKEIRSGEMDFVFAQSGEQAINYLRQHNHEAVLILSI